MTTNELVEKCHSQAVAMGWWPADRTEDRRPLEIHMLICSEVAEATEAVRHRELPFYLRDSEHDLNLTVVATAEKDEVRPVGAPGEVGFDEALTLAAKGTWKPEGEAVELADAVIRVMDYFGRQGWDLEAVIALKLAYNATRGHRHGGKAA